MIANHGDTDRVHLVFDIMVNDQITSMFEQVRGEHRKEIEVKDKFTPEDKLRIISHLRMLNTAVAHQLTDKMEDDCK